METKIQGYIFTEKNDWMRQKPKFYYLAALAELQRSLECRYFIYSYFILFYFLGGKKSPKKAFFLGGSSLNLK